MKLGQGISWLLGNLQRSLLSHLEECWGTARTEKEQQLVFILELVRIARYVPWSAVNQWMARKLSERESIARTVCPGGLGKTVECLRCRCQEELDNIMWGRPLYFYI
jgi:hypothetical protein